MSSKLEYEGKTAEDAVEAACKELGLTQKEIRYDVLSYGSSGIFGLVGVKKARIRVIPPKDNKQGAKKAPPKQRKNAPCSKSAKSPNVAENGAEGQGAAEAASVSPEAPQAPPAGEARVDEPAAPAAEQAEAPQADFQEPDLEASLELAKQSALIMAQKITPEGSVSGEVDAQGGILVTLEADKPAMLIGRRGQTLDAIQYLTDKIVNRQRKPKVRVRVDAGGYLERREKDLIRQAIRLGEKVRKSGRPASFNPMSAHDRRIVHLALKDENGVRTQSKGSGYLRKLVIFPQKKRSNKAS